MWPNPQFPDDLDTFTEETFNGKLHFLCSALPAENEQQMLKLQILWYTFIENH